MCSQSCIVVSTALGVLLAFPLQLSLDSSISSEPRFSISGLQLCFRWMHFYKAFNPLSHAMSCCGIFSVGSIGRSLAGAPGQLVLSLVHSFLNQLLILVYHVDSVSYKHESYAKEEFLRMPLQPYPGNVCALQGAILVVMQCATTSFLPCTKHWLDSAVFRFNGTALNFSPVSTLWKMNSTECHHLPAAAQCLRVLLLWHALHSTHTRTRTRLLPFLAILTFDSYKDSYKIASSSWRVSCYCTARITSWCPNLLLSYSMVSHLGDFCDWIGTI